MTTQLIDPQASEKIIANRDCSCCCQSGSDCCPKGVMSTPLWKALDSAVYPFEATNTGARGQMKAAEIRALAEIIEQRGAQGLDRNPSELAAWLRAEAERAEAGT
jgi:hypothetical protein